MERETQVRQARPTQTRRNGEPNSTSMLAGVTSCLLAAFLMVAVDSPRLSAQQAEVEQLSGTSSSDKPFDVQVGILGRYRLGQWCAIQLPETIAATVTDDLVIQTLDGDGVPVDYAQASRPGSRWAYAIPGSEAAPLVVKTPEDVLLTTRFPEQGSPSRQPSVVPLDMPWIVVIGDPIGIETIGANEILDRDAQVATSVIAQASSLPDRSLGFRGVDLLVINASGIPVLSEISDQQGQAIVQWIRSGRGQAMISLGDSAPQMIEAAPWLLDLLPFDSTELPMATIDPSAIETYTSSQTRLEIFRGVRLPREHCEALITGRTTRRVSIIIAGRYFSGFGRVTLIAADLDGSVFSEWPERMDLVTRLNQSILALSADQRQPAQRATGFNDLAGQVRATLDQFPIKQTFGFSLLSLIMMGLVLLIGPIDYLVINRLTGKPLLGWLTLPLIVIGFCTLLVMQSRAIPAIKDNQLADTSESPTTTAATDALNRMEIVDIDVASQAGRGIAWSFLYSHDGGRFDISAEPSDELRSQVRSMTKLLTAPLGFAGPAFGGIQIQADSGLPTYRVEMVTAQSLSETASSDRERIAVHTTDLSTIIHGIPIAPRSSKSFGTTFSFSPNVDPTISIRRRNGSDLLEGGLVNPLAVDLLDGMLIYRNWAYLLPTRLPAGGRIEFLNELRQRNFRWYLTRQQTLESNGKSLPWDPAKFDNLLRVTEMLMFHDVVGSTRYTGLLHGPLSDLDFSNLLTDDQCILLGRLAQPMTQLQLTRSNDQETQQDTTTVNVAQGNHLSMVRVILPVVQD